MIDIEHAKRVLAHQEDLQETEYQRLLLEIAERLIAIENRLNSFERRTREHLEDFLRGQTQLTVRFDRLESKLAQITQGK